MSLSNWETDKLEKIFYLGRGRVINDEEIKKFPGPYPVYSSQSENNGCFGNVNFYEFEGEYITWTTDGANAGTVFFRDGRFNCTNVCGTLKAKNPEEVDSKLFSYLISREAYKHVAVVGNNKLMNNVMGKIKITYPKEISEQRKIASILSKVDDAIQAIKNTIEKAERLKKSLMQNLLTGKLKPDGTWRTDDEFYEDEKFGKYPKDWLFGRFKEFSVLQRGKDLTDNEVIQGDYPVVKSNGVQIHHNSYFVEPPGVVTGRSGTIGKVFYIEEKFWAHNTSLYVKDFKGNNEKYIYYLIMRMKFDQYFAGTTVPTLNRNDIHKIKVAIPKSIDEQIEIVKKIDSAVQIIEAKQQKIQKLESLKKALMQNLLTGKVRVKV